MRPWFRVPALGGGWRSFGLDKANGGAFSWADSTWTLTSLQVRTVVTDIQLQLHSAGLHQGMALDIWVWDTTLIALTLLACDTGETQTRKKKENSPDEAYFVEDRKTQ